MQLNHSAIRERANEERWKKRHFKTVALANRLGGLAQDIGSDDFPDPLRLAYKL